MLNGEPGNQIKPTSERAVLSYLEDYIGTIIVVRTTGLSSFVRSEN